MKENSHTRKKEFLIGLRGFMLEIKDLICVSGMVSDDC